jgi:hypothetical protein
MPEAQRGGLRTSPTPTAPSPPTRPRATVSSIGRPPPAARSTPSAPSRAIALATVVPDLDEEQHPAATQAPERPRRGMERRVAAPTDARAIPRAEACLYSAAPRDPRADRRPHHCLCQASPAAASGEGEERGAGWGRRWRGVAFPPLSRLEETTRGGTIQLFEAEQIEMRYEA